MLARIFPLLVLLTSALAAFLPLKSLQNQTMSLLSRNVTSLSNWPDTPFIRHFEWDTDIAIINRTPYNPSGPTSESSIVADVRLIGAKVRSEGTRLAMMQHYEGRSGIVSFAFHGTSAFFRGSEIAMVLDTIAEMMNWYGVAGVYGSLVMVGANIAYFEVALMSGFLQSSDF